MTKIHQKKSFRDGLILTFIGWTLLILFSGWYFANREWEQALEHGRNLGRAAIQKDYIYRLWNASHGGVYVPVTETTPPNPYLKHLKNRDVTTTSGISLTKLNPAYMTRQVHAIGQKEYGIQGHITSLKPLRPENRPDAWEIRALKQFHQGRKEISEPLNLDSKNPSIRIMTPLITRTFCLKCHAHQGHEVGDIRGGISTTIPMAKIITEARQHMFMLAIFHVIIFLLGSTVLLFLYITNRKRLTEITQANQIITQNEKMLRGIIDNTESAICVYKANHDGSKFYCKTFNPAGEKLCQLKTADIIDLEVREVFPTIEDMGLLAVFKRVWRSGQTEIFPISNYDDERISIWVENKIFKLPSGEIVAVVDNLTAKKQAEEKMKKSRQAWQKTFDALPDIITIMDNNFTIIQANQAAYKLFNQQGREVIGHKCHELFNLSPTPCFNCPALKTLKDAKDHIEIIEHRTLNRTYMVTVGVITNATGDLINLVHSACDISKLVELEGELFQTRKLEAIGTLAGGVAHDFNNILTVIRGHAELAMMQSDERNPFWNDLKAIEAASERASQLTRQLLAFSRKEKITPEIILVNPLIKNLYKMLKRLIGEEINLEIDLGDKLPPIMADPGQFEQIIINLVINAADATRDIALNQGRRVSIITTSTTPPDNDSAIDPAPALCLQVRDNGCGIPEEVIPLIFDPFFTTKESGKGTGLGLSTVHGIVEQNKGRIEIESQPGQGTTFTIYWPGIKSGTGTINDHRVIEKIPGGNETILVAEDDQAARNLAVQTLQQAGYTVIEAADGEEAIAKARNHSGTIDLLFSDLVMPKMGGIELAENITRRYPETKILLVSGYLGDRIDYDNETLQKTTFLNKPYRLPELLQTIRQLLD
ncbi:MAG: ATP-binding protein [Pseudomonadota bacterium]|nr:ATP-binding protein [Pseudomonadota bacterium]